MATLIKDMSPRKHCHDCGTTIGNEHFFGCDVESCVECGLQKLSCECETEEREIWTGIDCFRIRELCEKHNLYTKFEGGRGWVPATKDDPKSMHDLNTGAKLLIQQNAQK